MINNIKELKYLGDTAAKENVEIIIRQDGLVIWINLDGQCAGRIITNGLIPIIIDDNRNKPIEKPYLIEE